MKALVSTTFDPSLKDETTEHYPSPYQPPVTPRKVRQLGTAKGPYEKKWKRKNLVRKYLKENKNSESHRVKRSIPLEEVSHESHNSEELFEARLKRNFNEDSVSQSNDRAAVWSIQEAFEG